MSPAGVVDSPPKPSAPQDQVHRERERRPPQAGGASTPRFFPEESSPGRGPVGEGNHTVRDGECVSSIAAASGLKVDAIWLHPDNETIREIRRRPNVLLPRDRLTVPDPSLRTESRATDLRHRFQLVGEPTFLRIRVKRRDIPMAGCPFTLRVGGQAIEGVTDGTGLVEARIPPEPTTGFLRIMHGKDPYEFTLAVGCLHPVDAPTGVQQRLHNLGFECGAFDGMFGTRTRGAIKAFQKKFKLPVTGVADPVTRAKLEEEHGC
jgi:N-acetylmuramoyl-L-alanine amidase